MPTAAPPPHTRGDVAAPVPWSHAWSRAAATFYAGDDGRPAQRPADHFRTSAHVGDVLGRALARLLQEVDAALGSPPALDLVDVGSGDGDLLVSVLDGLPGDVAARVRATAVDVRPRPAALDERVAWAEGTAPSAVPQGIRGLLIAHELLDDVPCDVVEVDADGTPRLVLVDRHGVEAPGPAVTDDAAWDALGLDASRARAWLSAWWPLTDVGDRAELGLARDDLWRSLVSRVEVGTALAVDYGHSRGTRPEFGSLVGYVDGEAVAPVPDGRVNLTAHVAVDALAHRVGASVRRQRESLLDLGVDGALPAHGLAGSDPAAYLDALASSSRAAELLDPSGLGAFWWVRTDL